jgi:glycosyltransferase involved in cell wall biosynthesis
VSGPRVSIGVPVYNGGIYLRRALDLLAAQTLSDIEIIISDNGSSDDTEAICRDYAAADRRIRYVRQAETSEASVNFMYVLGQARAPYFMWAAHDDAWSVNFVAALYAALEQHPGAVSAQGECVLIDAAGGTIQQGLPNPKLADRSRTVRVSRVMAFAPVDRYNNLFMYGVHRTAVLRRFGIKSVRFARAGESRWNELPLLFSLASAGRLLSVAGAQFHYRVHSQQYGQRPVPIRDILRLEAGLVTSVAPAVWAGSPSLPACVVGTSVVLACRIRYLMGMVKGIYQGSGTRGTSKQAS